MFRDSFAGGEASLSWMPHPISGDIAVSGEKVETVMAASASCTTPAEPDRP